MTSSAQHSIAGPPRRILEWSINASLIFVGILFLVPFVWAIITSVLTLEDALQSPPVWLPDEITFENYRKAFDLAPLGRQLLNTIYISGVITLGSVATSVLAGYAFARMKFPGRNLLFAVFLASLMIPQEVTVIPVFIIVRWLDLTDTHTALIAPGLIQVIGVFLMRQWFRSMPSEMLEAAKLDGASHFGIIRHIALPLSRPPIVAFSIWVTQVYWNEFFWANIILSTPEKMTLPVGLVFVQRSYGAGGGNVLSVFAAVTFALVPIILIFVFLQRHISEGIAMSASGKG